MNARAVPREIWALILLAAVVRLPWLGVQPTDLQAIRDQLPDQAEYLQIAHNLLQRQSLHFHDPRFPGDVFAFRMPGYPAFIALLGGQPTLVRLAQVIIDCSTVLAVYLLARRWFLDAKQPTKAPLVAGLLCALNPWLIYFSSLLLTETLFTACLAWGMVLLSVRWPYRRNCMLSGLALLAVGVYLRPSALLFPVVLGFLAVWANRPESRPYHMYRRAILRESLVVSAIAGMMTVALLTPWALRNRLHDRIGAWVWTTTNAGITAYDGFQPGATGASDQRFIRDLPELQAMTEVERSVYLNRLARESLLADPARTAGLAVRKIARTWSPLPLSSDYGRLRYILPGLLFSVPFFILMLIGLWTAPLPRLAKLFLLAPAIYLTLIHAFSVGSIRYRIPAEAPMAVIAAGATTLWEKRRSRPTDQ
jgi:4-amino-4-deoxy-L-arabinose transferase-like glycosyltransferase